LKDNFITVELPTISDIHINRKGLYGHPIQREVALRTPSPQLEYFQRF
jgi:hypothetical protein